jgi:hypothetical protein
MIVRVSEKTDEIELAGNAKELDWLSRQLLIDNNKITLEYKNLNPFPYSKNLESIQIKHIPNQNVKISVESNSLLIQGSPEKLRILSENIETGEEKLENYHIHIEYFDGHFFLSKDSIPLVVNFQ